MANLDLKRPIAFIDLESTGLDPRTARIVRITVLKIEPDGSERFRSELVNPGQPIPPGAAAVHGIEDDDVAEAPPFRAFARALADYLDDCDFAGFGIERFDLPLLDAEFRRAGFPVSFSDRAVVDAMVIFHKLEPRDFEAACRRFAGRKPPKGRDPEDRIRAKAAVLDGQLSVHSDLPSDPEGLGRWIHPGRADAIDPDGRFVWSEEGEPLVNFGRNRGLMLEQVATEEPDYLEWIAGNPEFSAEARRIAAGALEGRMPTREGAAAEE
jgi:DNA polymerase-3 subunit epsilon